MRERLLEGIEVAGYKKHGRVSKLARLTGYSIGQVSDMLSGNVSVNDKFIRLVCGEHGLGYVRHTSDVHPEGGVDFLRRSCGGW